MSTIRHNLYSQTGCIGCKSCEGGGAAIGRAFIIGTIILMTGGFGLFIFPFYKKCMFCRHNTWLNAHQPQPESPAQQPATLAAPGYWGTPAPWPTDPRYTQDSR